MSRIEAVGRLAEAIGSDIRAIKKRLDALETIEDLTAHKVLADQLLDDLGLLHRRLDQACRSR